MSGPQVSALLAILCQIGGGGSRPNLHKKRPMAAWIPAELADASQHQRSLTWQEFKIFYCGEFPWTCGTSGLWAWRGWIAKKLLGRWPTTDDVDLPADHPFFDRLGVEETRTYRADGSAGPVTYMRFGRRLSQNNPYVRRYRESLSRS